MDVRKEEGSRLAAMGPDEALLHYCAVATHRNIDPQNRLRDEDVLRFGNRNQDWESYGEVIRYLPQRDWIPHRALDWLVLHTSPMHSDQFGRSRLRLRHTTAGVLCNLR